MRIKIILLTAICSLLTSIHGVGQISVGGSEKIDYASPKEYEIGGIQVVGTRFLDPSALIQLSGLSVGDKVKIPGESISGAIRKLWRQKLFEDIDIAVARIQGGKIFLNINVKEQPRLSRFTFYGVTKSQADDLREDVNLYREKIVTPGLVVNTKNIVEQYFIDKGFLNTIADIEVTKDSIYPNHVMMLIDIDKQKKVRIENIFINGNKELSDGVLRRSMKETKERFRFDPFRDAHRFLWRNVKAVFVRDSMNLEQRLISYLHERFRFTLLKSSKFMKDTYEADKLAIIAKYNAKGYRDARIINDTIYKAGKHGINIKINVEEGKKYYFRNINWIGNTKYSTNLLSAILGIKKGDVYNRDLLDRRLMMNPQGKDVSSLYMDDGYLFFNVTPVEVLIEGDSIDMEIRIYEGQQARVNRVWITGNTKTNDHVIMREIRTKPGMLFSRSDIIRSQRELANLGYFNPETLNVNPKPNPSNGTVDIEYIVEERPSDQLELSGGFGAGRIVGSLGVSFTNFSMRRFFKKDAWTPLPSGDGQKLSIRGSSTGPQYWSISASFTEPWLGGKRPNSFSVSTYVTEISNGQPATIQDADGNDIDNPARSSRLTFSSSLSLGKRLRWPDDYFTLLQSLTYQYYDVYNSSIFQGFTDGEANNIFYKMVLSRNSVSAPIYPKTGSTLTLSFQATPPYSLFSNLNYSDPELSSQDKHRWVEYYKIKFTTSWFTPIVQNLVLNTRIGFGFLGHYNEQLGTSPFERFYMGGSGLTGAYAIDAREVIGLRGYDDNSVSPTTGGAIISKYTLELRYPVSLNPSATIYGLGFVEAGNTWNTFSEFNPLAVKRSAGFGVRIFLPMFGLLGLDWGYRFDDIDTNPGMQRSQIHFTIGMNLGEL